MNRKHIKKRKIETSLFILFFINIITTTCIMVLVYRSFNSLDFITEKNGTLIRVILILVGLGIEFIAAKIIGQKPISLISEFSEATKEVAKGNFNMVMSEDTPVVEINEMANSFNIMTERLANTEMFRNDFISNVSHEFKTPLAAIEGYASLLQNKDLSEEKRELYASKILYSTKRLSALTGNILMLSNLENQSNYIKKEEFLLDEQIRECILFFDQAWESKELNIDVELENISYYGNKEMLEQVWLNLIGNSIKFTLNKGNISVTLTKGKDKYKDRIIASIYDDGIGMDEKTQSRIFEKFYQGDTSHTSEGNGLGLNIVKRIIDLHCGDIGVVSKEGQGTTFTVIL